MQISNVCTYLLLAFFSPCKSACVIVAKCGPEDTFCSRNYYRSGFGYFASWLYVCLSVSVCLSVRGLCGLWMSVRRWVWSNDNRHRSWWDPTARWSLVCLFILNWLLFYEEGNTFNPYTQCALVRNTDYQHILSVPLRYSMGNSRRLRLDRTSSRFKMNVTFWSKSYHQDFWEHKFGKRW